MTLLPAFDKMIVLLNQLQTKKWNTIPLTQIDFVRCFVQKKAVPQPARELGRGL